MILKQLLMFLILEVGGIFIVVVGDSAAGYAFGGFLMLCGIVVALIPSEKLS